jgi:hypothetical protein
VEREGERGGERGGGKRGREGERERGREGERERGREVQRRVRALLAVVANGATRQGGRAKAPCGRGQGFYRSP